MNMLLAVIAVVAALGIQAHLMWRIHRRLASREKCEFLAELYSFGTALVLALILKLLLHSLSSTVAGVIASAGLLNYLVYVNVGLEQMPRSKGLDPYGIYATLIAVGVGLAAWLVIPRL